MRKIDINCILTKLYSIENGKIVKRENGKYFSKEIAKMILINEKHGDFKNIEKLEKQDEKEHIKAVKKYCETKTKQLTLEENCSLIEKNYEIFGLNLITENIYLFNKKDLPPKQTFEKQELFFKFENAQKAFNIYKQTNGDILINFSSKPKSLEKNLEEKYEELELIKKDDEKEYLECIKIYEKIKNTDFIKNYNILINENEILRKKNKQLEQLLIKVKEKNKNLEEKLKVALKDVEENRKSNIFKKILKKVNNIKK